MSEPEHREVAFSEHGKVCKNCGGREDIQVHHRDRDGTNNDASNLVPLCEDCHRDLYASSRGVGDYLQMLRDEMPSEKPETEPRIEREIVKLSPEAKGELEDYRDARNHTSLDSAVRELLDEVDHD